MKRSATGSPPTVKRAKRQVRDDESTDDGAVESTDDGAVESTDDGAVVDALTMQLEKIGLDKPVERRIEERQRRLYRECNKRLDMLQSRLEAQTQTIRTLQKCEDDRKIIRNIFAEMKSILRKENLSLDDRRQLNNMIRRYNEL